MIHTLSSLIAASALVLVHLFAERLRIRTNLPRSRWLSFAGGVSVAYVFVHLLPELGEIQEHLTHAEAGPNWLGAHAYLLALAGLVGFYGLERHAAIKRAEFDGNEDVAQGEESNFSFWLHVVSFSAYNGIIGYLIGDSDEPLFWFTLAMALHFVVIDFALQRDHEAIYRRLGRWIVSGSVAVGWLLGWLTDLSESLVGAITALLAGGVILNVMKEELPEERQSSLVAFVAGSGGYAVLLLIALAAE